MKKQKTFAVQIDENLQKEFKKTINKMGLTKTEAIRLYMKQVVLQQRIPFKPVVKNKRIEK